VEVKNFTSSWRDGRAFGALIASHCPKELNFDELPPPGPECLARVFAVAEKLRIASLLDVEDAEYYDKKSVATQLTLYYQVLGPMKEGK
jgi:hypothetical protein